MEGQGQRRTKGEAEARRIVQQAQRQADQVFAELDELRKQQQRSDYQAVNDRKSDIRRRLNEAETALHQRDEDTEPVPAPTRPIAVGDTVELAGVRTGAAVLAVNGDGTLLLQAGKMKMTVKAAQVRLLETAEEIEKKKKQSAAAQQRSGPAVSINHRGAGVRRAGHPGPGDAGGRERGGELPGRGIPVQAGHRDHHPRQGYRRCAPPCTSC